MEIPQGLTFEALAKGFMSLVSERYPSSDKAKEVAAKITGSNNPIEKMIVLTQFRDAIREVSASRIYRSLQHRDDLALAILEALEDLEDEIDEMEEGYEDQSEPASEDFGDAMRSLDQKEEKR